MKLLITSGGTKVPIDTVRDITNMSRGTFGAKIASYFLGSGQEVDFLAAKGSRTPFKQETDFTKKEMPEILKDLSEMAHLWRSSGHLYREIQYRNFEDYRGHLFGALCKDDKGPDITILAAAVSDHGTVPMEGKVRTKDFHSIELFDQPKLISEVKEYNAGTFLVGFKLLVDSTVEQLEEAAIKQAISCGCEVVIANDLRDIKDNNHICRVYDSKRDRFSVYRAPSGSDAIANDVCSKITELWYRRFE